jgi:predicted HNH restriction endonuclease
MGVDEENIVPVCPFCHSKIHQYGINRVQRMLNINLWEIAKQVWRLYEEDQ